MSDLQSFFAWWFIVTLFGLVTWPITARLFRFLPDRGYSLAKTAGLLAVGYVGWLLGNFRFIEVDAGGVTAALLIVGAISVLAARGQMSALRQWLSENRWYVIAVEGLFLIAFGAWAIARAYNPTITATEKPMEFAFLNSVLRTGLQPPGDPWLAGYAISYYHFGYVMMGMLTALSGVLPSVAFNLGIALLFGLTAMGAFGIVANLIGAASNRDREADSKSLTRVILPALLGPLFVLLGNLNGALEVAHQIGLFAVDPAQVQAYTACPVDNRYCLICKEDLPPACSQAGYKANFWGWLDIKWTNDPPTVTAVNASSTTAPVTQWTPSRFLWWWQSSRVIHDRNLFGDEVEVIDEFPFFSFLLGDMHPHVLGLPFVFLGLAFGLNLFLMVQAAADKPVDKWDSPELGKQLLEWFPWGGLAMVLLVGLVQLPQLGAHDWLVEWKDLLGRALIPVGLSFVGGGLLAAFLAWLIQVVKTGWSGWFPLAGWELLAGAIIIGGLSFLNTWDFPIYVFVSVAAYILARAMREGWTGRVWRAGLALGIAWVVLGVLLYAPFYLSFRSQLGGILPNLIFGTPIQQFTVMFGPSLFGVLSLLGWLAFQRRRQCDWQTGLWTGLSILVGLILVCALLTGVIVLLLPSRPELQDAVNAVIGQTPLQEALRLILERRAEIERVLTPVLLTAILVVAVALAFGWRRRPADSESTDPVPVDSARPIAPFAVILILTGALLTLGPEFVYLRDFFGARMNTVFKFYYQAWVLWSIAAAFGAWLLLRSAQVLGRLVFGTGLAVVVAMGLLYPTLATATITDNWRGTTLDTDQKPYPTLDGMAYMHTNRLADYEAIKFLNATVKERPVIAEAVGGSYTEFARISVHTGLPTVIGWPFHEQQWRGSVESFAGREDDIRTLYKTNNWDQASAILKKYNIRYVYVGPMELTQYEPIDLRKFDENLGKVYEANGVIIYEYKGGS